MNSILLDPVRYQRTQRAEDLLEIAELYIGAFPSSERRPMRAMVPLLSNPHCHFFRIEIGGEVAGLLHLWQLDGFCFCEHFAVQPEWRGRGVGERAMRFALREFGNVVLEVEPPVDELSARRVAFYGRIGFSVIERDYAQPQYVSHLPSVHLYLMGCRPDGGTWDSVQGVVRQIHDRVYGVSAEN